MLYHFHLETSNGWTKLPFPPDGKYELYIKSKDFCTNAHKVIVENGHLKHDDQFYDLYAGGGAWGDIAVGYIEVEENVFQSEVDDSVYLDVYWFKNSVLNWVDYIRKENNRLKEENEILQELVDRPDGAGCKFSYEQIQNLLI